MAWKRNAPYLILVLLVSQVFAGFGCGSRQAAVTHSEPSPPVAAPGLAGGPGVTLPPPKAGRAGIADFTGARCDYFDAHLLAKQ